MVWPTLWSRTAKEQNRKLCVLTWFSSRIFPVHPVLRKRTLHLRPLLHLHHASFKPGSGDSYIRCLLCFATRTTVTPCTSMVAIMHTLCCTWSSAIAEWPRDASCQSKSCQLPRNSTETTWTTSPEQIEVMKLKRYSKTMCNKHVHSTVTRSCRFHHGLRGSASHVLMATAFVNGRWQFSTPHRINTPWPITKKFGTGDYVGGPYGYAKFGANPLMGASGQIGEI